MVSSLFVSSRWSRRFSAAFSFSRINKALNLNIYTATRRTEPRVLGLKGFRDL
jgi:hypothetical protein